MLTISTIHAKEVVLTNDNSVALNSPVTAQSVSKVINEIKKLDAQMKSGYPIYLFLNTPGGSIQAGLELIEFLKGVNRPVHTITLFAASMGFQIVQHAGSRYITEYGVLMSHKASGGFQGEFGGNSSQLDSRYTMWLRRLNMMDSKTVQRTKGKKTLKQYQAEYDNELWLNGAEAVKNGYADEVVSVKCSANLEGEKTEIISFMGIRIEIKFDKCPLVTSPVSIKPLVRTNKGMIDLDSFVNSGGIFDQDCKRTAQKAAQDWSGQVVSPSQDAELCSLDKNLDLQKIENIVQKYKNENFLNNKQILKMSFSAFVSE
jgi:ATP-dependent Clp protease protease subunit